MRLRTLGILAALVAGAAPADDRIELGTSTVTGNRELPKVMVIVPWKKAAPGEVPGRPTDSLLDEALAPVSRTAFRRELANYRALEEEGAAEGKSATEE